MPNDSLSVLNQGQRRRLIWRVPPTLAAALAFGAVTMLPVILLAEERSCRGELGAVTVDNLRVPDGAQCTLNRTQVKGTIKVESKASLDARGVRVVGNVQAENARQVSLSRSSRVGGSVQIKQGGSASVLNSVVQGDIQYEANGSSLRANDNKRWRKRPGYRQSRARRDLPQCDRR